MRANSMFLILLLSFIFSACGDGDQSPSLSEDQPITGQQGQEVIFADVNSFSKLNIKTDLKRERNLSEEDKVIMERIAAIIFEKEKLNSDFQKAKEQILKEKKGVELKASQSRAKYNLLKRNYDSSLRIYELDLQEKNDELRNIKNDIAAINVRISEINTTFNIFARRKEEIQAQVNSDRSIWSSGALVLGYDSRRDDINERIDALRVSMNIPSLKRELTRKNGQLRGKKRARAAKRKEIENLVKPSNSAYLDAKAELDNFNEQIKQKEKRIEELVLVLSTQQGVLSDEITKYEKGAFRVEEEYDFFKNRQSFFESFTKTKSVNLSELLTLYKKKHFIYFRRAHPETEISFLEFEAEVKVLGARLGKDVDQLNNNLKKEVEMSLAESIRIEQGSKTIVDYLFHGIVQNYSATASFLMMAYLNNPRLNNLVVIIEKGEILPGVVRIVNNKKVLTGFNVNGEEVDYGVASSVKGDIRVIEGKQFLLFDLLGISVENEKDVLDQMLDFSEKYLGFKKSNMKAGLIEEQIPDQIDFSEPIDTNYLRF